MRFTGHISSNSLFFVSSPKWIVRNFPKVTSVPTDAGHVAPLNARAVSDTFANRDLRGQFRQPAKVIAMPMSHNQVIDLLKACIFDRSHNAAGVARSRSARIAGVDEQRLPRRRN